MDEQLRALENKSQDLSNLMEHITLGCVGLPAGNLQILSCRNKTSFYQYFESGEPRKYLKKSQSQLIAALAQKRYLQQVYVAAQLKKKAVDKCVAILKSDDYLFDLASIYVTLPSEIRALVKPVESFDAEYARKWQQRKMLHSEMPYEAKFKSKRGEYVRSKSELIIADRLYDAGIPYHYEVEFRNQYGKLILRPDFYVLNPRTRKEYLWEHFGMLDNEVYANDFVAKMNLYAKYNYFPGDKLIVTVESSKHPLTPEQIQITIDKYLK